VRVDRIVILPLSFPTRKVRNLARVVVHVATAKAQRQVSCLQSLLKLAEQFLSENGVDILCHTSLLVPLDDFENKMGTALETIWFRSVAIGGDPWYPQAVKLAA